MYSRENEQTNREATNNNPKNLKFTSWGVKKNRNNNNNNNNSNNVQQNKSKAESNWKVP